ncbi:MAG: hypothetical protein E7Z90_02165 [Cyanobacteria bacterium SIG29]|nr:hypothetical protein [Cyanobacteria bacterium SIG29]
MTNVLNKYIANQPISPVKPAPLPAFTFNSEGKIKPLDDKAKLLPSRIFGSPIEYAKDLKQDVVNIGRAAKGKANDHELGRINDVAMKLGSLALATYLFVKNPLKLSKAMEFVGFGTFFASMSLWPKLAIQAPIKARTGVDIHQKYIDSQGRKKMLHQDPQYDLTDLYSREDLDKMGKKLGVAENLPDRDSFIKQRAKKTAVQGNTLWMMTAGIATPVMSALACNRLEKPINNAIEAIELKSSENALKNGTVGFISRLKQSRADKALEKFLKEHADDVIDDKMATKLSSLIGGRTNAASIQEALKNQILSIKEPLKINEEFITRALQNKIPANLIASLTAEQKALLDKAMADGSLKSVATILSQAGATGKPAQKKMASSLLRTLETASKTSQQKSVGQVSGQIRSLYASLGGFTQNKQILDRFIDARVGDKSGTYIANQWTRVCDKLIKSLNLNSKELKALADGNVGVLQTKLEALAGSDKYDDVVAQLMKLIGDYEVKTGSDFISMVQEKTTSLSDDAFRALQANNFEDLAKKFASGVNRGTIKNVIDVNAKERALGAQSSFYRLLQSLELYKRIGNGTFEQQLTSALGEVGKSADKATIKKLTKACKDLVLNATTTDYVEKLKSAGFELTEAEYKAVMKTMFGSVDDTIEAALRSKVGGAQAKTLVKGFNGYKQTFMSKVADWQNSMTPELARRTVNGVTSSANAIERNNLAGKPIKTLVQDVARQTYNSQKWLKIFGGVMAGLTAVTLVAGLAIGRKGKMEKQVEEESKKLNG